MGTLQTSLTKFFSTLKTFPKLLKKMKIVILLLAVLAVAAVQNAKAADEPAAAAVKAADFPDAGELMAETQEHEGEDDVGETHEDEGENPLVWMMWERPTRMRERIHGGFHEDE